MVSNLSVPKDVVSKRGLSMTHSLKLLSSVLNSKEANLWNYGKYNNIVYSLNIPKIIKNYFFIYKYIQLLYYYILHHLRIEQGHIKFARMYTIYRMTRDRSNFYYINRFRISFCIDLRLSVRPMSIHVFLYGPSTVHSYTCLQI